MVKRLITITSGAIGATASETLTYTAEEDYLIEKILIQQKGIVTAAARDTIAAIDVDGDLITKPESPILAFGEQQDKCPQINYDFDKGSKLTCKLTSTTGGTFYVTLVCERKA